MLLVNTEYIAGKELEMLGLVKGSTIHSKHLGKDIAQAFKTMVGGELTAYNDGTGEVIADIPVSSTEKTVLDFLCDKWVDEVFFSLPMIPFSMSSSRCSWRVKISATSER